MSGDNLINVNWRQQVLTLKENLAIIRKRSNKKAVHDLRVSIKKLRSYLRLKKKIKNEEWKEEFSNTAALFSAFGQLRDFEISLALVRRYERKSQASFINLKKYITAKQRIFRRSAKNFSLKYSDDELTSFDHSFLVIGSAFSNDDICERIIYLSNIKKEKIKKYERHFQHDAHKIRKLLKDVYYWQKIIPEGFSNGKMDLKALDKVLDSLGNWQDHFILKEKIGEYRNEKKITGYNESLKILENKLISDQKKLIENAKKKWHAIHKEKGDL